MIDVFIILSSTVFNALADRYYPIRVASFPNWSPAQWRWHFFKWAFFYPPLARILYLSGFVIFDSMALAVVCFVVWRIVYNYHHDKIRFVFFRRRFSSRLWWK